MRQSLKDNFVGLIDDTLYFLSDDATKLTSWSKTDGVELIGDVEPIGGTFTEFHVIKDSLFFIMREMDDTPTLYREIPNEGGIDQSWGLGDGPMVNAYLDWFA